MAFVTFDNKSSAVAEMGDRGHNRHNMGRKEGGAVPLSRGELGPHLTQCGVGRGLLRAKWRLHLSSCLATIDMGRKLGAVAFGEELRPHLTQRRLGRGLPPYQVASRSIQQWVGLCPFILGRSWVPSKYKIAWAEAYLHTKWHLSPSSRLATTVIGRKLEGCAPLGEGSWVPI